VRFKAVRIDDWIASSVTKPWTLVESAGGIGLGHSR
jgi:hypothetical protein